MRWISYAVAFLVAASLAISAVAQEPDGTATGDSEETDFTDDTGYQEEKLWEIGGYIESENFFMYNKGLKRHQYLYLSNRPVKVARNETLINKVEAHAALDLRVGTETLHARSFVHAYLYPPGNEAGDLDSRIVVNELYLKWLTTYTSLKVGKQLIRWGTADAINPTSYFTPMDLTELLFKDEDELFMGVYAVSLTFLFSDFSLQLACTPVSSATLLPDSKSPWAIRQPNRFKVVPVYYYHREPDLPMIGANVCYGGRLAGTISSLDFSISAYRGIDRDVLLQPLVDANPPIPTVYVIPKYRRLTCFGLDFAIPIKEVTIQGEAVYSPNKQAVQNPSPGTFGLFRINGTHYLNFAVGLNWLIDGEDFNITLEFNKSLYLIDSDKYRDPYISNLAIARIEKRFLSGKLFFKLQGMVAVDTFDYLLMPVAGYDLQNGLLFEVEGGILQGTKSDSLFGSFNRRDIVRVRVKYSF